MMGLQNKTVVITGASRGIGKAAAIKFVELGANVLLLAKSAEPLYALAESLGKQALAVPCDVANYDDVQSAVKKAVDCFGTVDICVNNAGLIDPIARFEDSDPASWARVVDVNVKGVYNCMHTTFPYLRQQGGVIINLSSGAATNALEGWSHYCSTKAAVLSLTRCGHKEWSELGIRVVGLSPGTVATTMQQKIKASGINAVSQLDWSAHITPEEVAQAIVFLTSESAAEYAGQDFSIKTPEGRRAAGLPPRKLTD